MTKGDKRPARQRPVDEQRGYQPKASTEDLGYKPTSQSGQKPATSQRGNGPSSSPPNQGTGGKKD